MPTATKKTVAVKRTPTKKSVPAPAKKTVAKPKAEAAPITDDPAREFVDLFLDMIKGKELDSFLSEIGHALDLRVATHENEKKAAAKKGTAGNLKTANETPAPAPRSKGSTIAKPPTKKSVSASSVPVTVTPVAGKNYKIKSNLQKIGGATVTFVRYFKGDEKKSVIKMVTDKPGYPKGTSMPVPTSALEPLRSATNHRKTTSK